MRKIIAYLFILFSLPSVALEGIQFKYDFGKENKWGLKENTNFWNLVCDNSGTCRMVGYINHYVSVYFERKAGNNTPVIGKITGYKDGGISGFFYIKGRLFIDGKDYGKVETKNDEPYEFTQKQTNAILKALAGEGLVEIRRTGNTKTIIPNKGATAVMLKMDEFQQRLDTPSALVRKGNSKKKVLQPQRLEKVKIPHFSSELICSDTFTVTVDVDWDVKSKSNECGLSNEIIDEFDISAYFSVNGLLVPVNVYNLGKRFDLIEVRGANFKNAEYIVSDYIITDKERREIVDVINDFDMYKNGILFYVNDGYHYSYLQSKPYSYAIWNGENFILAYNRIGNPKGFYWELPIYISDIDPVKIEKIYNKARYE